MNLSDWQKDKIMTIYDTGLSLNKRPPRIVVLALPGTTLSSVAAPVDIFGVAGTMWNKIMGQPPAPIFEVCVVSPDGQAVPCHGIPALTVHDSMHSVGRADLIVVTALLGGGCGAGELAPVLEWLREQHRQGASIASLCTGTFVLAATGLLNGKTATTHWGVANQLQQMYPKVQVTPHRILTDEGTLFTSGGTHGALDLCLYLVQRFSNRDIALQCAKVMVRDFEVRSQSPYAVFRRQSQHADVEVAKAQGFLDSAYHKSQSIDELARGVGLGKRTFERRFKQAVGTSPRAYIQQLRIEAAKRMLETGNHTLEQITETVGYEDPATFSRLFSKMCGISPSAYRKKFAPIVLATL